MVLYLEKGVCFRFDFNALSLLGGLQSLAKVIETIQLLNKLYNDCHSPHGQSTARSMNVCGGIYELKCDEVFNSSRQGNGLGGYFPSQ